MPIIKFLLTCPKCSRHNLKIRNDGTIQKHNIIRGYRNQRMKLDECPASLTDPKEWEDWNGWKYLMNLVEKEI